MTLYVNSPLIHVIHFHSCAIGSKKPWCLKVFKRSLDISENVDYVNIVDTKLSVDTVETIRNNNLDGFRGYPPIWKVTWPRLDWIMAQLKICDTLPLNHVGHNLANKLERLCGCKYKNLKCADMIALIVIVIVSALFIFQPTLLAPTGALIVTVVYYSI